MWFKELYDAICKAHIVIMSEDEFMNIVYQDCMEKVWFHDEEGNALDYELLPRYDDLQNLADCCTHGFDVSMYECVY